MYVYRKIKISSLWASLSPVSKVYGVFSNRDLPSTSGVQPREEAIIYKALVVSLTTVTIDLKKVIFDMVLVVVRSYDLWEFFI